MDKTIYKLKLETINEESILFIPSAGKCGVIYTLHKDLIANCFKNTSSTALAIQEIKKCFEEEWVNRWYFILYDIDFDDLIIKYYNLYIKPNLKESINDEYNAIEDKLEAYRCMFIDLENKSKSDCATINNLCNRIKELAKELEDSKYIIKEYSQMQKENYENIDKLCDKISELTFKKEEDCIPYKELYNELLIKSKSDEVTIDNLCNKVTKLKDIVVDNMESLRRQENISCLRHAPPTGEKEVTSIGSPEEPFFTGKRIAYFIATLAGFSIIDLLIRAYIG